MAAPRRHGSHHAPAPTRALDECEWKPGGSLRSTRVIDSATATAVGGQEEKQGNLTWRGWPSHGREFGPPNRERRTRLRRREPWAVSRHSSERMAPAIWRRPPQ